MTEKINQLAKIIWDYHHLNQKLKKADCLLVMCSHDARVAPRAVELFQKGYASYMVIAGGLAHQTDLLNTGWDKPEAEVFADIMIKSGISKDKIFIETESHNCGENIEFSRVLLVKKHLHPKSFIVVTKPYMERRALATFKKVWPGKTVMVTSPQISFKDYPNKKLPKDLIINIMVGDLQRIKLYGGKFQIPQKIPPQVWQAYEKLVQLGYNKHLISEGT